ncbi:MAG: hypothetical protein AB4080_07200 [Trichodesmium sp.]
MFGINLQATYLRKIITFLITVVLISGLVSCSDRLPELSEIGSKKSIATSRTAKISEVSPPEIIQKLRQALDIYKPKIKIQNPLPDQIFEDNTISVQLQVEDLPIFKSDLDIGPYLEVVLDDQHYGKIYDLSQPIILHDLEPGTHTLRVFACRPWDESFKNQGAYAQTTFHVFTKTANNNPAPNLPLLTYNSPLGSYGAEPILLDYYLTNPPLNSVDSDDEMVDWRVRVTVNGTSFITDQWQSIYLEGFYPGKNWVKLEYIDELGNPINNVYNNTARLITYKPGGKDALSKIIRGEILLKEAFSIVDPEYIYEEAQLEITPEVEEIPATEDLEVEENLIESEPEVEEIPTAEELEVEENLIESESELEEIPTAEDLEVEENLIESELEAIPNAEDLEVEENLIELEPELEKIPTTEDLEVEANLIESELELEAIPTPEDLEVEENLIESELEENLIESELELEEIPTAEDLEVEANLIESESELETIPTTESTNPEDLAGESEALPTIKTAQETDSQSKPTESEKLETLKEKTDWLINWAKSRFESINKNSGKQEKLTEETTLNTSKESENIDSVQPNESLTVPEIVEEVPIVQPAAEIIPQETSNLTPNTQEITNSETDYSMPEDEDSPQENTVELEEIQEDKSNVIDDYPEYFTEEIENENVGDSVENITE